MTTPRWLDAVGHTLKTNSPAILSGISVAGVIGTAVLAVKATPEAQDLIDVVRRDKFFEDEPAYATEIKYVDLSKREIVKATWRCYIPAATTAAATIACIIGANAIGARRQASLLGAYTLVDQSFRTYKDKVLEQITPQKADKVEDELNKERLQQLPVSNQVFISGKGEELCMDSLSGRYFNSDMETIRRAENDVNQLVLQDMFASQNEFYDRVGLAGTTLGAEMGWNIDNLLETHISALVAEDGRPCLVIGYRRLPKAGYEKL